MKLGNPFDHASAWDEVYRRLLPLNAPGDPTAGSLFERVCKAFFCTEPASRSEFKRVWHHSEIPPRIRRRLTINRKDHGVDVLLEHQDGRFFAVQCKFKTDSHSTLSWTKDRLSSWLSEGDECEGLILFTNCSGADGHTISKASKKDFRLYTGGDLQHLNPQLLRQLLSVAQGAKPLAQDPPTPRRYQSAAIAAVVRGLRRTARGQLILPCGAGKTLVSLWIKERLRANRTLVLVPSLALMRQTKREWATAQAKYQNYLCVCSESGIDRQVGQDAPLTQVHDLQATVTTKPASIGAFLKRHDSCVVYSTYQSLPQVAKALRRTRLSFDLAICDEAHRTATGRGQLFTLIHDTKEVPAKRRLYMTATPKVTSAKLKSRLGERTFDLIADMSDPAVFGSVLYQMTFGEAIKKAILVDYRIVVVGVSDRELHKAVEHRAYSSGGTVDEIASNLALAKIMRKYPVRHTISFHASIRRAKRFLIRHRDRYTGIWSNHVNGTMSTSEREALLSEFRQESQAILTNARCLTEGIDVPAIDCVYFCDPKSSPIDIVQASGRALRQSHAAGKRLGYVVVPVFHRSRKDIERAIESSVFRHVIAVVRALADQDERIQAEIHALVSAKGRRVLGRERIQVEMGEERLEMVGFEASLKRALFDQVLKHSSGSFEARLRQLLAYKARFGSFRVPHLAPAPWMELGRWVHKIRELRRYSRKAITQSKIDQLDKIGFDWRVDGQTLDSVSDLVSEKELVKQTGLTKIPQYRESGDIVPVGWFTSHGKGGLSAYYSPKQANEIRKAKGVTLTTRVGLLSEKEFESRARVGRVGNHRARGLIKEVGTWVGGDRYYRETQIGDLRRALGATFDRPPDGLMTEHQFMKWSGFSEIRRYRREGLVTPRGFWPTSGGLTAFYDASQRAEVEKALGITITKTRGLLNESQIRKEFGLTRIQEYRQQKLIRPVGRGLSASKVSWLYRCSDVKNLKNFLGITLEDVSGLISEKELRRRSGIVAVRRFREQGRIKPLGWALTSGGRGARPFYRPEQVGELRRELGITLTSTRGLLTERKFSAKLGFNAALLRTKRKLTPQGYAITQAGVGPYYHPNQAADARRALGITLASTKNLVPEPVFAAMCGLRRVKGYRERGVLKPVGMALHEGRLMPFYRRTQVRELNRSLGVTLKSTKGLLPEYEFARRTGLTNLQRYRAQGLIKPEGLAISNGGLCRFYRPAQERALRAVLKKRGLGPMASRS